MKESIVHTLEYSKNLIISPDIDGLLSAKFINKQYGSQIVGTYDKNILCISDDIDPSKCLFVDCDMNRPEYVSIGNHMRLVDDNISPTSFNPNNFYKTDKYTDKFPYATCFLIASALDLEVTDSEFYYMGYADSTFLNMRNYGKNMKNWADKIGHRLFNRIITPDVQDLLGFERIRKKHNEQQAYVSKRYGKERYLETLNNVFKDLKVPYKELKNGKKYLCDKVGINTVMRYNKDIISYAEVYMGEYSITYDQEMEWK